MMNQEIKARWVAWLRANVDKQSFGRLQRVAAGSAAEPAGFCCLGGLCELAVEDGIISSMLDESVYGNVQIYGSGSVLEEDYDWDKAVLPRTVIQWAGLSDPDPDVSYFDDGGNQHIEPLTAINDSWKLNFNKIADLIEEQL